MILFVGLCVLIGPNDVGSDVTIVPSHSAVTVTLWKVINVTCSYITIHSKNLKNIIHM